ncbi:MAG: DUF4252 domain-containing protein [Prevotellaceae bacterium]|jgi:hypothetical protein|nr:DUF4252 domain-containing protein [Prevotellaceae bacterium]
MKKTTIFIVTLLIMAITAQAQGIEKLVSKYSNDKRFTYVALSADLIQFGLSFIDDVDINKIIKDDLKLKGLKLLTLESESEADEKMIELITDELDDVLKKDSKSETVIETREKGDVTKVYATSEGLLIVTRESKELSVIFLAGELSAQAIKKIISQARKK